MTFSNRITLALATGYIFYFYSERVFWSFIRPDDNIFFQVATWLVYSLFAYMFLALVAHFRVRTIAALFLSGVAFGWIGEGIYAMTFFGAGGIPMPVSFIWTGVAWHALITVMVGWYYLQKSLVKHGYLHTLELSLLFGLFWGVWATAWILETPPLSTSAEGFITHALVTTFFLIIALVITAKMRPSHFVPSPWEYRALFGVAALSFLLLTVPIVQGAAVILLIAFGVLYILLRRNKKKELLAPRASTLEVFDTHASLGKYACLVVMPLTASLSYIGINAAGVVFPTNVWTLIVSSFTGSCFFLWSTYRILRK